MRNPWNLDSGPFGYVLLRKHLGFTFLQEFSYFTRVSCGAFCYQCWALMGCGGYLLLWPLLSFSSGEPEYDISLTKCYLQFPWTLFEVLMLAEYLIFWNCVPNFLLFCFFFHLCLLILLLVRFSVLSPFLFSSFSEVMFFISRMIFFSASVLIYDWSITKDVQALCQWSEFTLGASLQGNGIKAQFFHGRKPTFQHTICFPLGPTHFSRTASSFVIYIIAILFWKYLFISYVLGLYLCIGFF